MALNPFFLQGSPGEQRLVQDLINEHLKIYGVEVTYIPRKFVNIDNIFNEVQSSAFNDTFLLEAYVNTYDGYSGAGDVLTKFGMSLRDELSLVISKERFEDFITPFLNSFDDQEILLSSRPKEGDLVYFPLGNRLFEVKFVEHEQPFYQLGKNYVYEIKCELFEYEDEVIDTSIDEIDELVKDQGYISTLQLVSYGSTATASASIGTGYVKQIFLNNDGIGYTSPPTIGISSAPPGGTNATAVATIRRVRTSYSIDEIYITNAGIGYTEIPTVTITGGGGTGAAATCSISTTSNGVVNISILNGGVGYSTSPSVTISGPGIGDTATAVTKLNNGSVSNIYITNSGTGYTQIPTVTISNPESLLGFGTFIYNEVVIGSTSQTKARVKEWDQDTGILKVSFIDTNLGSSPVSFYPGEIVSGTISSARYSVESYNTMDSYDKYNDNEDVEQEAAVILDFSESNPFGTY
jgi:hypothetical protein